MIIKDSWFRNPVKSEGIVKAIKATMDLLTESIVVVLQWCSAVLCCITENPCKYSGCSFLNSFLFDTYSSVLH